MFGSQATRQMETMAKEPSPSQLNTANYGNYLKVSWKPRRRRRTRRSFPLSVVVGEGPLVPRARTRSPSLTRASSRSALSQVSKDKLSVQYVGKGSHSNDVGAIQADSPVPSDVLVYYYEVFIRDAGERGVIAVGFADFHFRLSRQPGWEPNSYGYHADDGNKFHNSGKGEEYGPSFVQGDTVGAGIHLENREIFFTKNGKKLGVAFQNVKATLFPTVGLHSQNEHVEVNFGAKPFQFDIEGMIAEEREQRQFVVLQSKIPSNACHSIVCSYLKHYGYADTLRAFSGPQEGAPPSAGEDSAKDGEEAGRSASASFDLEDRKRARQLFLKGEVTEVKDLLSRRPSMEPQTLFHLEVQQFIELLREEKVSEAVEHARSAFSSFQGHSDEMDQHLEDVLALLAYRDPSTSPMGYLMTTAQREAVADVVNNAMLPKEDQGKSVMEKILVQLCRVQAEIRRRNDNKGEIFKLEHFL